jgi:hypothetical protein
MVGEDLAGRVAERSPDAGFVATVYRADTNVAYLAVAICKS